MTERKRTLEREGGREEKIRKDKERREGIFLLPLILVPIFY